jgi:hypothetical protein
VRLKLSGRVLPFSSPPVDSIPLPKGDVLETVITVSSFFTGHLVDLTDHSSFPKDDWNVAIRCAASLGVSVCVSGDVNLQSSFTTMPRVHFIQKKDLLSLACPFQSKAGKWLSRGLPTLSDIPPLANDYAVVPVATWPAVEMVAKVYDFGGSGDCLLRCFFAWLSTEIRPYSVSTTYEWLGHPSGFFLEDIDLVKLGFLYGVNVLVLRKADDQDCFLYYDLGFSMDIALLNLYPTHYCLIHGLYTEGSPNMISKNFNPVMGAFSSDVTQNRVRVSYRQFRLMRHVYVLPPFPTTGPLRITDEMEWEVESVSSEEFSLGSSDSEEPQREVLRQELQALPPSPSPELLFHYVRNFSIMWSSNSAEVLYCFKVLHREVVSLIRRLDADHKRMPSIFFKNYYKCRHNTFSFLCNEAAGYRPIETDMPLDRYIDSKRTPDLIKETEKDITLFEFTVSNRYDQVDLHKGGFLVDLKYQSEADQITKKTGKPCKVLVVPAVLNMYNIDEISELAPACTPETIRQFMDISNENRDLIASAYFSTCSAHTPIAPGENEISDDRETISIDSFFIAFMLKNWSWFLQYCVQMMNRNDSSSHLVLCYDMDRQRAYLEQPGRKKLFKVLSQDLLVYLRDHDLSAVVSCVNVFKSGGLVPLRELSGDVVITIRRPKRERYFAQEPRAAVDLPVYNSLTSNGDEYDNTEWSDELITSGSKVKYLFKEDYFDKLCAFDFSKLLASTSPDLLANNIMSEEYITEACGILQEEYTLQNNNPRFKFSPKPTFMWPFASGVLLNLASDQGSFLTRLSETLDQDYTVAVLKKAARSDYFSTAVDNDVLTKAKLEFSNCRQRYTHEVVRRGLCKRYVMLTSSEKQEIAPFKLKMMEAQRNLSQVLSLAKRKTSRLVRLPVRKNTNVGKAFKREMEHFQRKNKGMKGVGHEFGIDQLSEYMKLLATRLLQNTGSSRFEPLYGKIRSPGSPLLTDLKDQYTERWEDFYQNVFSGSLLDGLTEFASRLAKVLFNESMKPYNNDFVKVDHLGFENVVVLCRGGPKAAKNNHSRLFKVIFPINQLDLKYSGYEENPNYKVFEMDNILYVCTPWSLLHLDVLYDGFTIRERCFSSLYSTYSRTGLGAEETISPLNNLPSLLMLHNRRKTESLMHNMRYLIVNPLGRYSNIKGIIKSFGTFNHTYLDAWLKSSICKSYRGFATKLHSLSLKQEKNLNNLLKTCSLCDMFFHEPIRNVEQLTFHIYSTYLMTKAPVNNTLEQANNLKSILEDVVLYQADHSDVQGMDDKSQHIEVFNFNESAYKDDFVYDPTFCQYLGYHMASYLKMKLSPNELNMRWQTIMSKGLSSIANSNGLRGYRQNNFFSKKGYEVVFDKVIDVLSSKDISLDKLVETYLDMDYRTACDAIRADVINSSEMVLDKLTFHVVHKIQRGGGREIFCMDLVTKAFQSPIEEFMKFLCKSVPNEFISVPSNLRHGMIHRDFYERTPAPWIKETIRWVLDCRRWAPHSVFQKYVHFVHGMSAYLPGEFTNYFSAFADKMFTKEFCTRQHVVNAMKNNASFDGLKDLLFEDAKIPGKHNVKVPFSFVMGIFNYLSTLMHAANQMVASEVCLRHNLMKDRGLVVMDAKCHSDDSVCTTYHERDVSVRPTVLIYDWLLKCANHMLSIKKSQINNNVYLEFLSTLYLFDRFVPVVPKFVSSMPFKPTDLGYSSDVTFAASQAIELLLQGGTMEEAFLMSKLSSRYIQKIYNLNENNTLPYSLMGNFDPHPLELLLSGVESDILNHYHFNKSRLLTVTDILIKKGVINDNGIEGYTIVWDMSSRISTVLKQKYRMFQSAVDKLTAEFPWTLTQCKLGNDYLSLVWYLNKLNNPKYYSSLVNEPDARRYSRAFGSYRYRHIYLKSGATMPVSDLTNVLTLETTQTTENSLGYYQMLDELNPYLSELHEVLSGTKTAGNLLPNGFKTKPVSFLMSSSRVSKVTLSTQEAVSYMLEPKGFKLLAKKGDPAREIQTLTEYIRSMGLQTPTDPDLLAKTINFALGRKEPKYNLVAAVPSDEKRVNDYNGVVVYLMHNSFAGHIIPLTATRADVIDWSKKVARGRTPRSVVDYVECREMLNISQAMEVSKIDIFIKDLSVLLEERFQAVPIPWRPLVYSVGKDKPSDLVQENYWTLWLKKQVKVGRKWFGTGRCVVSVPEATMEISINNGIIMHIRTKDEVHTEFSLISNWYLIGFLNQPGLRLAMMPSEFGDPAGTYFGFNDKSGRYGIGSARMFDHIFDSPSEIGIAGTSVIYNTVYLTREGRYWQVLLPSSEVAIVEFYTPGIDSKKINFQNYIDRDKVQKLINHPKVKDFCMKVSFDLRSEFTFKKQDVVDTIGFSKLYKIIYNNPESVSVFRGLQNMDVFYESFSLWKTINPDFQYPSENELEALVNQDLSAHLPSRVLRLLHRLGKSSVSRAEVENIILGMYQMQPNQRLQYLLSVIGPMSTNEKSDTIVLALRSDRFFDTCRLLGNNVFRVWTPLMIIFERIIEESPCSSETLELMHFKYARGKDLVSVFRALVARVIFVGLRTHKILSSDDPIAQQVIKIIEELWDTGASVYLNLYSSSDPLLRTIEFGIDRAKFIRSIVDMFDSIYLANWTDSSYPVGSKVTFPRSEGYSHYLKDLNQLTKWMCPKGFNIITKKGGKQQKTWMRISKQTPGIISREFVPLDEADMEEFEAGMDYLSDPEEDLEFEDEGEAPDLRLCSMPISTNLMMMKARGTAHKLIIYTSIFHRGFMSCHGIKKYKAKTGFSCLEDYLANYSAAILYIGETGVNFNSPGWGPWSLDEWNKKVNRYPSEPIEVDGRVIDKIDLVSDSSLLPKVTALDHYFKRLKAVPKEVQEADSLTEVEPMIQQVKPILRGDYEEFKKKADTYLHPEVPEVEHSDAPFDWDKIIKLYEQHSQEVKNWVGSSVNLPDELLPYGKYNYAEAMNLLHDPEVLGEFNALFGNNWGAFENNELYLTKLTKRVKIERALYLISRLQPSEKEKYSKILFLMSVLLAAIPEASSFELESHSFSRKLDELFDVELDTDIPFDIMTALAPNPGEISKAPDLDSIFGRK